MIERRTHRAPERLEPVTDRSRRRVTAEIRRTCAEEGCGTRLSIYNSSDRCALHQGAPVPRSRRRRRPATA